MKPDYRQAYWLGSFKESKLCNVSDILLFQWENIKSAMHTYRHKLFSFQLLLFQGPFSPKPFNLWAFTFTVHCFNKPVYTSTGY